MEKELVEEEEKIMVELEEEEDTEEIAESKEEVSKEESVSEKPKFSEGFLKKYEGKSSEELVDILHNQEEFIGKQSTTIDKLRKESTPKKLTSKDYKQNLLTKKQNLVNYQDKLDKVDPELDDAEYATIKKRINQLKQDIDQGESDYTETYMRELVYNETARESNEGLGKEMRGRYKETFGLEFKDEEWDRIIESTKERNIDPKLTAEDFESTLIRAYGLDKYRKMVMLQGGVNEREKIRDAGKKEDKEIGSSETTKGTNLLDMSNEAVKKTIANNPDILKKLTPKQLDRLLDKINSA